MSDENVFIIDGIKMQWDDDSLRIFEQGFDRTAVMDNQGNILSSTFGEEGVPFLCHWFARVKPMIDDFRSIEKEYANT
ncbi:hypothetical protein OZX62_04530 [Bifidobacterium sp. ESL0690]|uniref:hypothetical protein n=1 Tax=Bifidobacterium sp. ESL0690 TaxID=2983214 RepID=UPI0023F621BE|nr:hypothetical protein [Bifidobacterium sp. ESL0690]WEV47540.1 hypothetical protein OZX62_04530 [Bifidobacterium sp. ESL0690]